MVRGVFTLPRKRTEAERLLTPALFPVPAWESAADLDSEGAAALRVPAESARRGWFPDDGWTHVPRALRDPAGTLGAR